MIHPLPVTQTVHEEKPPQASSGDHISIFQESACCASSFLFFCTLGFTDDRWV